MVYIFDRKKDTKNSKMKNDLKKVKGRKYHLQYKRGDSGVESLFVVTTNKKGYKIFPNKYIAEQVRSRQRKAAKHQIAPKVLSDIKKCYVANLSDFDGTEEGFTIDQNFGYFYQTEIATMNTKRYDMLPEEMIDDFFKKMKKLNFAIDDLHDYNVGFIKGRIVCIDFGDITIS